MVEYGFQIEVNGTEMRAGISSSKFLDPMPPYFLVAAGAGTRHLPPDSRGVDDGQPDVLRRGVLLSPLPQAVFSAFGHRVLKHNVLGCDC